MKCQHCLDLKEAFAGHFEAKALLGEDIPEPEEWTPEHAANHKKSCIQLAEILARLEKTRPLLEMGHMTKALQPLDNAIKILESMKQVAQVHGAWPEE
jgi:hypothetical protein